MGLIFKTLLLDVQLLAVCVFALLYAYFKLSYTYWKKRNVPYIKPKFPFGNLGDALLFRKSIGQTYENIYKKLEGEKYGGIYAFAKPRFIFRDPDIIKNILVKDFSSFHDRGFYMDEELEPMTGHLFLLPGNRWRNLRIKLSPTFTSGKMKMMFQTFVECAQELGSILEKSTCNEETLEINDTLARYSTDIISSCAFGIQCNSLKNPNAELRQWGRKLFETSFRNTVIRIFNHSTPGFLHVLNLKPVDPIVSKYFRRMVEETVNYRENNSFKRNDFMQLLIQIKNKVKLEEENDSLELNGHEILDKKPSEDGLSMDSLAAQALVFFFAGFETTSLTMSFCLYELSLNQDIQERLREEIDVVLKRQEGKITYEGIQQMEYLDKVVSETLRKYPALPVLNRECTKDYQIPGTDIILEKGMATVIPVLGLHYDPKYYPDPERFDPERFTEDEKARRHHYVYLPFGEGPRICIGMRFGLMQAKVGLVSLLSKYEFSVSKQTEVPLAFNTKTVVIAPEVGMWLQIKKRVK